MKTESKLGAVVAAAVVLAGCGGGGSSSSQKFKTAFQKVETQLRATGQAVGAALQNASSTSDQQLGSTFKGLAGRWQGQLSQLQTLKPPSNVAADFNTMVSASTRFENDLNDVVKAAATHSKAAGQQAGAGIITDYTAVRTADAAIRRKLGIK